MAGSEKASCSDLDLMDLMIDLFFLNSLIIHQVNKENHNLKGGLDTRSYLAKILMIFTSPFTP